MSQLLVVFKRHALQLFLSLTILLVFILLATKNQIPLEHNLYDARLKLTMPNTVDSRIVIVDVDERSLSEIGRWPWNRSVMARLIELLFDTYQIDVLGTDVVFAEPDNSSGLKQLWALADGPLSDAPRFLETLQSLDKTLDYDSLFAQNLQNRRIVLGYSFATGQDEGQNIETGQLPLPAIKKENVQLYGLSYRTAKGFAANLPQFQNSALAGGHFNAIPDQDGIVRRVPMLYGYKGQLYESLSLAVARIALEAPEVELDLYRNHGHFLLENLRVGNRTIPVDEYLQALVPYRGHWGSFPYISACDIWHTRIEDPNLLKDKIVLLGTTAQGLMDLRATPMANIYPGVEVHANLIAGILDNNIMSTLPFEKNVESLLLLLIGLGMIILLPLCSPLIATIVTLGLSGLIIWVNLSIWNEHLVFPLATTLLLIMTLFVFNMSYGYFVESRNKRYLTDLFGQYVPPTLVDEMSKNLGCQFSLEGESREMTVLFSDVRGFTSLSEGLDSKVLSELMNEYLTPMTHIIHEHRGTIDKYMGDAIMAFWGAPLRDSQHARHALDAALEMLGRLKEIQKQFKAKGWPQIQIGIGLNTGIMNVGNMGSQFRMAYTVLGDAVNLGSRLEGATKQYGVPIIVSETVRDAVPEYLYSPLDYVRVKGKAQPVAIFEPIGLREEVDESLVAEVAHYEQALTHYRQQHWEIAQEQFAQLCEQYPQRLLYKIYAERVANFLTNPPDDNWDGVYTFTTK